jgi:hypothetical protein
MLKPPKLLLFVRLETVQADLTSVRQVPLSGVFPGSAFGPLPHWLISS